MVKIPSEMSDSGAAAAPQPNMEAMLLRAIGTELADKIIPALTCGDAIDRAQLAKLIAENLAADLDVQPLIAARLAPLMRNALETVLRADGLASRAPAMQVFADELRRTPEQVDALRNLAARVLRFLADHSGSQAARESIATLGRIDAQWLTDYAAAATRSAAPKARERSTDADATAGPTLDADRVTQYLRRRFPAEQSIEATGLVRVPGGRSKLTYFLQLRGTSLFPAELVIRQDYALKYAGTKIIDEHPLLLALAQRGLPVPRPLHLEAQPSELGPPFMFVSRLSGKPPGTYFGMAGTAPGAFRELAAVLAQLHRIEAPALGLPAPQPGVDQMAGVIGQYQQKWRANATRASPAIDFAYAWAAQKCREAPGGTACVHGDCGPYNFLVDQDRLSAILDWEFAHVGDPAEDLGIARNYAEGSIPWTEFMDVYRANGGPTVSEARVQLGMLTQFLKGTTLVAASGRNYLEGGTREFIKGANAFTGLRLIEQRIAALLHSFGAT